MQNHSTNLFEVINISELNGYYQLYETQDIKTEWREDDSQIKNLHNLVKQIAYENEIPVALLLHKEYPRLAIPADKELKRLEYPLTPDVLTLTSINEKKPINFKELDPESKYIALSFLRFALQTPLIKDNNLWKSGTSSFFTKGQLIGKIIFVKLMFMVVLVLKYYYLMGKFMLLLNSVINMWIVNGLQIVVR